MQAVFHPLKTTTTLVSLILAAGALANCTVDFTDGNDFNDARLDDASVRQDSTIPADAGTDVPHFDATQDDGTLHDAATADALSDAMPDASGNCGNGIVETGEQCDTDQFGGRTCHTETGMEQGVLHCTSDCHLDTSDCHECGNGNIEGPEECDGADLAGATCQSATGMSEGVVSCRSDCMLDTSDCHQCGDGRITAGEECDDANTASGDGCSSDCTMEDYFSCQSEPSLCSCTIYVDARRNGDGSRWSQALASLNAVPAVLSQLSHNASCSNPMVWIARGDYHDLQSTITVDVPCHFYGSFAGVETDTDQRTVEPSSTIIGPTQGCQGPLFTVQAADVLFDGLTIADGVNSNAGPGCMEVTAGAEVVLHQIWMSNCIAEYGGALDVSDATVTITECRFESNSATDGDGGAILFSNGGHLSVSQTTFDDNSADHGGAIMAYGGDSVSFDHVIFMNNSSHRYGAGLDIDAVASPPVFESVTWLENSTDANGSALRIRHTPGPIVLNRCLMQGNSWGTLSLLGTGGLVQVNDADLTIRNSLVDDNYSTVSGPSLSTAIFGGATCGDITLVNVTLWNNTEKQMAVLNGHVYVTNSILWQNGFSRQVISGNCLASVVSQSLTFDGSFHCSTEAPLLVDPANHNFRLQPGSPCIDAASGDLADATDIEGQPRYDDPATPNSGTGTPPYVDIGAYEYH